MLTLTSLTYYTLILPFSVPLILYSFFSCIQADEIEMTFQTEGQNPLYRSPGWEKKTHPQHRAVCATEKAFAAIKIPRLQLYNQYISGSPVSHITLLI